MPLRDDGALFELLNLEGAQAGLSWSTVLKKREHYRLAFDHFDIEKIARYDDRKVAELLANPGIVRNRLKVTATIGNAQAYLALRDSGQGFSDLVWQFVQGRPVQHQRQSLAEVPTQTPASDAMSQTLRKAGFKFVGSTICYAFMQASGMVNDHLVSCHRHAAVQA